MGRLTDSTQLGYKEKYGADSFLARRSEVRSELFCLATCASAELQIQSDPAKMVFESGPVDVDPGQGFVTLEDGSEVHGDLVNIADGIQQACMEVGELSGGWHSDIDGKGILNFTQTLHGKHRMMVSYPLSKFQHFNISLLRPAREGLGNEESSWHADANRDVMLDDFRYFDESLVRMMTMGGDAKIWDMQDLGTLPRWVKGSAIIIGDAAHANNMKSASYKNVQIGMSNHLVPKPSLRMMN